MTITNIEDIAVLSLGIINIILILILMRIYIKNYLAYKSKFALGLLIFISFLMIHGVIAILTFFHYKNFINMLICGPISISIIFILELFALIGLLITTRK